MFSSRLCCLVQDATSSQNIVDHNSKSSTATGTKCYINLRDLTDLKMLNFKTHSSKKDSCESNFRPEGE